MKVANPDIFKIDPYRPGRPIADVKRELGLSSVVKLASNELPYPPSPKVVKAIEKAAATVNRYPDGGCFLLREALAKRLHVAPEQLIFGNGSDEIIIMALRAFAAPGDEVVVAAPSFLIYEMGARLVGAKVRSVPLQNFCYDLDGMANIVTGKTRLIFIGNPDNPAGTYVTAEQLSVFIKKIHPDILIFIDEAYFEYVRAKDYPDSLALLKKHKNIIVTRTFSKMYGLAGLRIGYGIANERVVDVLNRLREPFNVNALAQAAALACLKDQPYYRKLAKQIEVERKFLYDGLTKITCGLQRKRDQFYYGSRSTEWTASDASLVEKRGDCSQYGVLGAGRIYSSDHWHACRKP